MNKQLKALSDLYGLAATMKKPVFERFLNEEDGWVDAGLSEPFVGSDMRLWRVVESHKELHLLPCPCCSKYAHSHQDTHNAYTINCSGCGLQTTWFRTREEAAKAWNIRKGKSNGKII